MENYSAGGGKLSGGIIFYMKVTLEKYIPNFLNIFVTFRF